MAAENKFDKLRSMVHQGVPMEKPVENATPEEVKSVDVDSIEMETEMKKKTLG